MSHLMQVIFGICGALVFIGAVQIISPQKAMKKSVDFILGVIFVLTLLTPVFTFKNISLSFPEIEQGTQGSRELFNYTADYIVRAALDGAGIKYEKLEVSADISEDNRISIIKVALVSGFSQEQVAGALKELVSPDSVEVLNE